MTRSSDGVSLTVSFLLRRSVSSREGVGILERRPSETGRGSIAVISFRVYGLGLGGVRGQATLKRRNEAAGQMSDTV
jgi:hypothetical protein